MKIPVTVTRKQSSTTISVAKNAQGLVRSETIIVELQGVLESSANDLEADDDPQALLQGVEIGLIDLSNSDKPILRIGNHELEGKCLRLTKPLVVMRRQQFVKKNYPGIEGTEKSVGTQDTTNSFDIVDIIERKLIFSKRPQPIVVI